MAEVLNAAHINVKLHDLLGSARVLINESLGEKKFTLSLVHL